MRAPVGDVLVLSILLALALARPLAAPPIILHGEAREGLVVQDIVARGQWVLPRRNGALPSKPPLFHWLAAALARGVGLSDVSVRLPSALGAWGMSVATLACGVGIGGRLVGWLAVGALWGTVEFWTAAAEARVDMVFSACVTMALVAFLAWYRGGGRGARAVGYLGATLAVLAKGPAGAILVGVVVAAFLALQRDRRRLRALWSWPLAAACLVVLGGWYGLAGAVGGREFLSTQLLHENLDRFVGHGEFRPHRWRNPLRMELALLTHLLPWNLTLVRSARRWLAGEREDAAGRFLHAWWIAILAVFTLAAGKRGVYLLPLYPAVALLAARTLAAALPHLRVPAAPAGVRRLAPARPALAALAFGIVVFDATLLAATQVVRERRAERESLVDFAAEAALLVPPEVDLRSAGLPPTDVWVLAYRMRRPIGRARLRCHPGVAYLVPADATAGHPPLVVSARRKGGDVALVRCER